MGLNKHELATIVETNLDNFSVTIKCSSDDFWFVVVKLASTGAEYEISTARGALKSWRNPADAIRFVQDACHKCNDVKIEIGTWTFARI
jgi:hypothetical protein